MQDQILTQTPRTGLRGACFSTRQYLAKLGEAESLPALPVPRVGPLVRDRLRGPAKPDEVTASTAKIGPVSHPRASAESTIANLSSGRRYEALRIGDRGVVERHLQLTFLAIGGIEVTNQALLGQVFEFLLCRDAVYRHLKPHLLFIELLMVVGLRVSGLKVD